MGRVRKKGSEITKSIKSCLQAFTMPSNCHLLIRVMWQVVNSEQTDWMDDGKVQHEGRVDVVLQIQRGEEAE